MAIHRWVWKCQLVLILVISKLTFRDLFYLVNTGARNLQIGKDGKTNLCVPFRKVDERYELKLRAKTSYFKAVRIVRLRTELLHERQVLNHCATADGYSRHSKETTDLVPHSGSAVLPKVGNGPLKVSESGIFSR